ncbi:phosphoglycerate kinase [Ornithinimicrobium sp. CNJ-824]|jgi:phosphoglycerate kinase|uniref:phosphoglycerate kinase n=1 Tax=Ornithinimicrobium sp. CNJ-824 TaxID=1904966 RepID=UPI00095A4F4F|nr:phosphoglycerate kinase [Ornithinimicrobium sp. CNJ-824]OLT19844.1 phosphoglycerate kinase [Ornithinimicrobium sp. CNJ-824]
MRSIAELTEQLGGLAGRTVLVRSDLNVPLDGGRITDDGRVRASVPTIEELASAGARVVVTAHLGRPKGAPEARFSLRPVADRLGELLGRPVTFVEETVGPTARAAVEAMSDGDVVVLENLRFNPGETAKADEDRAQFAQELAALADAFVSDGFGVVHRAQASVYDVARLLPHAAGGLVRSEVEVMRTLREDPQRPYAVILGGAKVSDKLGVIESLITVADRLLVGGGMVFTFLKAQGHEVGTSLLEEDQVDTVRGYLETAAQQGVEIVLPTDVVVADSFSADAAHEVVAADAIPADRMGLDIGPRSEELFAEKLADARTIFWNGPMGAFEMEPFASGTRAVAQVLVERTREGAMTVVGGGDSAAAVRDFGHADSDFGHISTGGGASLEYLEGRQLPGLTVLED